MSPNRTARTALGRARFISLALALAAPSFTLLGPEAPNEDVLVPGVPTTLALEHDSVIRRIDVPEGVSGLRVTTTGSDGDVELYAAYGRPPDVFAGDYDVAAIHVWIEETLFIEVSDTVPLEPGAWYFAVVGSDPETTRTTLTAELVRPSEHKAEVGVVHELELLRAHGLRARVEVVLPVARDEPSKGPTRWLVEVDCPFADVDASVVASGLLSNFEAPYASSYDLFGYERFVASVPRVRRRIALDVFAYQEAEHEERLPVRVLVQRFEPPTHVPVLDLCPLPRLPDPALPFAAAPFDTAAKATVVVSGLFGSGSGVVVSPDGYVLSCAHVLVGVNQGRPNRLGELERPPVSIGFTLDPTVPPVPAFGAEIVWVREDLDLSLVRITGDLLGRSLESRLGATPVFQHLAPTLRRPLMAEPLFGFGYPVTGGTASMVSLTMKNGVCAGYSRELEGALIKTDAEIHAGDSGGPYVDATGRCVGIAISSLADNDQGGGIGFIVPTDLLPDEWRARIGW